MMLHTDSGDVAQSSESQSDTRDTDKHPGRAWSPLAAAAGGGEHLQGLLATALRGMSEGTGHRGGPVPAMEPAELDRQVRGVLGTVLPRTGTGAAAALEPLARMLAYGSADPADPGCAGHLHCPPLAVSVAAEVVASALNPSLDSWDQAPAASTVETEVITALADLVGYRSRDATGVFTTGGTESNLMGMLLGRDAPLRAGTGGAPGGDGQADQPAPAVVFCSAAAHFSIQRNAAVLGLGESAVVPIPVDGRHRMDVDALAHALKQCAGRRAIIVATAGTTDLGAIDPLPELATLAREHGAWLHTDAAYGGGALFSERMAGLLDGLARSDSVALDLHKLGWQPIASGVFLARAADTVDPLSRRVSYLNPADDERAGYTSLLGRSLRTTRRADAFKVAVTMRALGREGLGTLVDACHELAVHAADRISAQPGLELAALPVLSTVVFRYAAAGDVDQVNAALRRRLLRSGDAVLGRTEFGGGLWLKLTLLNPHASRDDVDELLSGVLRAGAEEE